MDFDVFISYPHQDKATADAACASLEAARVRCWIAPRDIVPGKDWGEAIVNAIASAKIMVLIFSGHANASPQIKREVERAVNRGIPILPVRIENIVPSKSLEYYISTPHWLDAFTPPIEERLRELATGVKALLEHAGQPAALMETGWRPPSKDLSGLGPTRKALSTFNEARHAVWAIGFSIGVSCVAAIGAIFVALSGSTQAAAVIASGIAVAFITNLALSFLVLQKNPTTSAVGKGLVWTTSALLVAFLALCGTGIGLRWPSSAVSALGLEDGVTCSRPGEELIAFACGPAEGSYVVVNIRLDDSDFGLMVREGPSLNVPGKPIPPNGTGVAITGECKPEGTDAWCPVQCRSLSLKGWSRQRYLRPRAEALYTVERINPTEPKGLTIHSGPDQACRAIGVLPYQTRDVIEHWCQRSPNNLTFWCRITFANISGWILDGFLEHQN